MDQTTVIVSGRAEAKLLEVVIILECVIEDLDFVLLTETDVIRLADVNHRYVGVDPVLIGKAVQETFKAFRLEPQAYVLGLLMVLKSRSLD